MSGVVNGGALAAANTAFLAIHQELFGGGSRPEGAHQFLTEYVSATGESALEFVQTVFQSRAREWKGQKVLNPLAAYRLNLTMRKWEHTIEVDRVDIEYDKLAVVGRALRAGLAGVKSENDRLIHTELVSNSGEGPVGLDGVNLIDPSHPMRDGTTQSNKGTTALSFDQHDTIMQAGQSFLDHAGEPLGVSYDTMLVGPKNRRLALEIAGGEVSGKWVKAATGAFGQQGGTVTGVAAAFPGVNVFVGDGMQVILWERLVGTYDDYVYYIDTKKPYKPMALGVHRDWTPVELSSPTDLPRFLNGKYLYGVEADLTPCCSGWPAIFGIIL